MRYDLAFMLCCCRSFLGPPPGEEDEQNGDSEAPNSTKHPPDYYELLGIPRDATSDDIKRAYKKQSLLMHPDKLAQRGLSVTPEMQAQFTQMKEAYDVLSDPYKRDTYDALGFRGMKWMEEPFSMDPQELVHNFAKSSVLDRSKIFGIFVAIALAVLLQPILLCLYVDGRFGPDALLSVTFIPLWSWNVFLLLYHTHIVLMGPIPRPEHIPPEEWVDPLPMKKRTFSLIRFILLVLFEVLLVLKLDQFLPFPWFVVFVPYYVWEGTNLYKKYPLSNMRIVTVHDLEVALGKPFSEFTPAEKELIGKRYSVVASTSSPDFEVAQTLKTRARQDVRNSLLRLGFVVILLLQLDGYMDWSWWLVFAPIWVMSLILCCLNYQAYTEVRRMAMEKDPTLFQPPATANPANGSTAPTYGSVNEATETKPTHAPLTEEEREQLRAQLMSSSSKFVNRCCSQSFLLIIIALFVGKLQGADFSSLWIISPFLFVVRFVCYVHAPKVYMLLNWCDSSFRQAGLILCCIGCAIFGITEVPTDGIHFDDPSFSYMNAAETGTAAPNGVHPTAPPTGQPETVPTTSTTVFVAQPPVPDAAASVPFDASPPVVSAPEPSNLDVSAIPPIMENHAEEVSYEVDALAPPSSQETIPIKSASEVETSSPSVAPDDEINDLD
jgi:DnaJ domain/Transmembrane Fragile-X-F protein